MKKVVEKREWPALLMGNQRKHNRAYILNELGNNKLYNMAKANWKKEGIW